MAANTTFYPIANRQPPSDATVWRYLDIWKFLDLLQTRTLFFSRLSELDDEVEGRTPYAYPTHELFLTAIRAMETLVRHHVYANSWNRQETESAGLWPQYVKGPGVVLRTTYGKLMAGLPAYVFAGEIEYLIRERDKPGHDTMHVVDRAFWKLKEYEHEREVRLAIYENQMISLFP